VLFWWTTVPANFYVEGESAWLFSPFAPPLQGDDPERIHEILIRNGVTHLIAGTEKQEACLITNPAGLFVPKYLRELFSGNDSILYEVLPEDRGPRLKEIRY
jgi:hypothetical protein